VARIIAKPLCHNCHRRFEKNGSDFCRRHGPCATLKPKPAQHGLPASLQHSPGRAFVAPGAKKDYRYPKWQIRGLTSALCAAKGEDNGF